MLPSFYFPNGRWEPEKSVETMDQFGTETAMLSFVVPGQVIYDGSEKARSLARRANDYGAKLVSDHPKRFGLFACLPFRDVDASLKEIEYAFDTLHCDGIVLMTNTGDKWPGDPLFAPVFDELNRRKSPIFFHPTTANCCKDLVPGVAESVLEYDFDTTPERAVDYQPFGGSHPHACRPYQGPRSGSHQQLRQGPDRRQKPPYSRWRVLRIEEAILRVRACHLSGADGGLTGICAGYPVPVRHRLSGRAVRNNGK
jgi:hypothetical protein